MERPNNAMQLTRGGWRRLEAIGDVMIGQLIVNQGEVVRPSQLIASVGRTPVRGAR